MEGRGHEPFDLRIPLPQAGRVDETVARTDVMTIRMKAYAEGGENTLHTHVAEDHAFVVLQGEAQFHDENGPTARLGRYQGILLPKGTYYWFQNVGDEPLVLLRLGAAQGKAETPRIGIDGRALPGKSPENKHEALVLKEGAFFA